MNSASRPGYVKIIPDPIRLLIRKGGECMLRGKAKGGQREESGE
jgi:hypothetical protein